MRKYTDSGYVSKMLITWTPRLKVLQLLLRVAETNSMYQVKIWHEMSRPTLLLLFYVVSYNMKCIQPDWFGFYIEQM